MRTMRDRALTTRQRRLLMALRLVNLSRLRLQRDRFLLFRVALRLETLRADHRAYRDLQLALELLPACALVAWVRGVAVHVGLGRHRLVRGARSEPCRSRRPSATSGPGAWSHAHARTCTCTRTCAVALLSCAATGVVLVEATARRVRRRIGGVVVGVPRGVVAHPAVMMMLARASVVVAIGVPGVVELALIGASVPSLLLPLVVGKVRVVGSLKRKSDTATRRVSQVCNQLTLL